MPMGSVDLLELASAVQAEIETISDLTDKVMIADVEDASDVEELRKGMGAGPLWACITFPKTGSIVAEPAMGQAMIYHFGLVVSLLYRSLGNQFSRVNDGPTPHLSTLLKSVYAVLETNTLGILNQGGLACGPAEIIARGNPLQAVQFTVTARSREMRS